MCQLFNTFTGFTFVSSVEIRLLFYVCVSEIKIKIVERLNDSTVIETNTATFTATTNYDNIPIAWFKSMCLAALYFKYLHCFCLYSYIFNYKNHVVA